MRDYIVSIDVTAASYVDIDLADTAIATAIDKAIRDNFIPPAGVHFPKYGSYEKLRVTPHNTQR